MDIYCIAFCVCNTQSMLVINLSSKAMLEPQNQCINIRIWMIPFPYPQVWSKAINNWNFIVRLTFFKKVTFLKIIYILRAQSFLAPIFRDKTYFQQYFLKVIVLSISKPPNVLGKSNLDASVVSCNPQLANALSIFNWFILEEN